MHEKVLRAIEEQSSGNLEINITYVRRPKHLENIDGLILPGGESTVISKLLNSSELRHPINSLIEKGIPVFGTCAGLILLADYFEQLDVKVERNAYGAQIDSFQSDVEITYEGKVLTAKAFFIRAPKIIDLGSKAHGFAYLDGEVVGAIQNNVIGVSFHPEVAGESAVHQIFVDKILDNVSKVK